MRQRVAPHGKRLDAPAEQRGSIGKAAQRVADVELAVAEGALAVFPCLAPHDAGQADGEPRLVAGWRRQGAAFEDVAFRFVVVQAVRHAGQAASQDIGLDRVQIAGGRVAAQRPAARSPAFPGRDAERQFEQGAKTIRIGSDLVFGHFRQSTVAALKTVGGERQFELRRTGITPEGSRLGVPVELAGAFGIGVEAVLGAAVVGADDGFVACLLAIRHCALCVTGMQERQQAPCPVQGICRQGVWPNCSTRKSIMARTLGARWRPLG